MKCDFFVGQHVVCIDDDWPELALMRDEVSTCEGPVRIPMLNEILTIRDMHGGTKPHTQDLVWLFFEEFAGGFAHTNFRPLTDIGVFKALLHEVLATDKRRVSADA